MGLTRAFAERSGASIDRLELCAGDGAVYREIHGQTDLLEATFLPIGRQLRQNLAGLKCGPEESS
jgi:hypothetical protein